MKKTILKYSVYHSYTFAIAPPIPINDNQSIKRFLISLCSTVLLYDTEQFSVPLIDKKKNIIQVAAMELLLVLFTTNRRFIHHHSEQFQNLMASQTKLLTDWSLSFLEGSRDKPDNFSRPVFSKLLQLLFEVANCSSTVADIPWKELDLAICDVKTTLGFQREELRLYKRLSGKFNLGTKRASVAEGEGKKRKKMRLETEMNVTSSSSPPSNQLGV